MRKLRSREVEYIVQDTWYQVAEHNSFLQYLTNIYWVSPLCQIPFYLHSIHQWIKPLKPGPEGGYMVVDGDRELKHKSEKSKKMENN